MTYGYHLDRGDLILYGDNLKSVIPYIDNCCNSVEDICDYCNKHDIGLTYVGRDLYESWRVKRVAMRYGVWHNNDELIEYVNSDNNN